MNFVSYAKLFLAVFSITLGILFFKTKNFSLPTRGVKNLVGGGSNTSVHPLAQQRTAVNSFNNNTPDLVELDLNAVKTNDPNF